MVDPEPKSSSASIQLGNQQLGTFNPKGAKRIESEFVVEEAGPDQYELQLFTTFLVGVAPINLITYI